MKRQTQNLELPLEQLPELSLRTVGADGTLPLSEGKDIRCTYLYLIKRMKYIHKVEWYRAGQ